MIDRALRDLGHPDPQVANAAVAWARQARRRWDVIMQLWLGFLLLFVIPGLALFAVVLVTVVWGAIAMLFLAAGPYRFTARVESANLDALAGAAGTAGPPAAPAEVRMRREWVLPFLLLFSVAAAGELVLFIISMAIGEGGFRPWSRLALAIMCAALAVNFSYQFGRTLVIVGSDGVTLPRQRLRLPWSEITAVRPRPLVIARLPLRTCVVWEISSAAAVGRRLGLRPRQLRSLRRLTRWSNPPGFGFSIKTVQPDVIEIVRASRAFAAQAPGPGEGRSGNHL